MLKKTITYTDFDGLERKEDFYFNLTKSELTELNLSRQGGYAGYLQAIVDAKDVPTISQLFKTLILKGYGVKSDDGRFFRKSEEIANDFASSAAYDVLFEELLGDEQAAAAFFTEMLPNDLKARVREEMKNQKLVEGGNNG